MAPSTRDLLRWIFGRRRAAASAGARPDAPPGEASSEATEPRPAEAHDAPAIPLAGGRKPFGMSATSYADRQIEEAMRLGLFDHLPGKGKPLKDLRPDDPNWWLRQKLEEEGLDVPLPPALELQRDVRREVERLGGLRDERLLREKLEALNARIRQVNARHVSGPPTGVAPLDVDEFVRKWRMGRTRTS